ncbi:hypothetical protein ACJMK2_011643 [Sinanodonta woodiana]|uniref:peptidylprolyl isomerase n=1 Tax=Sinanodonta woodiana TaxID=1069815 RepID=A0ABD3V5P7_SINWO
MNDKYEEPTVRLYDGIDLNDLRDPNTDGVTFEVVPDDQQQAEPRNNNNYFDAEQVFQNFYTTTDSDLDEDDDNSTPFEQMCRKMEDVCPNKDGGVMKKLLQPGSGCVVPAGSVVRVHYNGFLEYNDEPYDSSRLRNQPHKFRLGEGEVIDGWDYAVSTMKKGELSRFIIKPLYAYGSYGCPPRIPENATIMYEIELLSFVEHAGVDDFFSMTEEEKRNVDFEDIKKVYKAETKEGHQFFDSQQLPRAFNKYRKAAKILEDCRLKNEKEEKEQQSLLLKLYLNMAVCCVKLNHSGQAITYSRKALQIERDSAKALYLMGKALHQKCEFDEARDYYKRAQKWKPQDQDINAQLEKLEKDMARFHLVEKKMYAKMFSKPVEQTADEKAKEDARIEKAKEKSLKCSKEFEELVRNRLQEFIQDPDLMELPFPKINLTVGEIACILEAADDLGLIHREYGSGQNTQIKILKRNPQAQAHG